jgi:hypothetical protein
MLLTNRLFWVLSPILDTIRKVNSRGVSPPTRKQDLVSKATKKAFAKYEADITPEAVKTVSHRIKALGGKQSAADIRWSAAMTLRDAVDKEIARWSAE